MHIHVCALSVHVYLFSPVQKIDLDITLHSPYIIVPEGGVYSERARLIVVSLGQVVVRTLDDKASRTLSYGGECDTMYDPHNLVHRLNCLVPPEPLIGYCRLWLNESGTYTCIVICACVHVYMACGMLKLLYMYM